MMYVLSARNLFIDEETSTLEDHGFDEIRSVLHPAEHCAECIDEADKGFMPLDEFIPLGERQCRHNDKCSVEYRNSGTGEIVPG